jgi:uncharacterized protein with LGFP repeats
MNDWRRLVQRWQRSAASRTLAGQRPAGRRRRVVGARLTAFLAAAALALGFMAASATAASAGDCTLSGNVCDPPLCADTTQVANCADPMYLHNGVVQHNPRIYLIFWGSKWKTQAPATNTYPSYLVNNVFRELRGSAWNNILTQYSDASGPVNNDTVLAGWTIDQSAVPTLNFVNHAITTEIDSVISAQSWSATADTQFIVFPQPGSNVSGLTSCGRHFMRESGALGTGAFVAYPTDQAGCSSGPGYDESDLTATALHEYAETVTDPQGLDYSWFPTTVHGYSTDNPRNDNVEIADKCSKNHTQLAGNFNVAKPQLYSPAAAACTFMHGQDYATPDPGWSYHTVQGDILGYYIGLGATTSVLGEPVSEEQAISTGRVSYFAGTSCGGGGPNGSGSAIYFTKTGGAHEVQGCIYHEYAATMGGPGGALGFPTTPEQPATPQGGRENLFAGTSCGSLTGSAILWTQATGAHEVQGCIYQDYVGVNNGPGGALGFPLTDEGPIGTGRISYFAGTSCASGPYTGVNSAILYSPTTGANAMKGCIFQTYIQALQGPAGFLGFPTSDELPITGGSYNTFAATGCNAGPYVGSGAQIYWNAAAGAAYEVHGCIDQLYLQRVNGGTGAFGLPTSSQLAAPGGAYNTFAGTGCTVGGYPGTGAGIYYNASDGTPYEVHGCIYQMYNQALSGPSGSFGLPTSDQTSVAGGAYNTFAGTGCSSGSYQGNGAGIFYNNANGAPYEVHGCIYQVYLQAEGGPGGAFGLPASSQIAVAGGSYNSFTGTSCTVGEYQGTGSAIVYNTSAGAAFGVQGCIYQAYYQAGGGPGGSFGVPTSGEHTITSGYSLVPGRINTFTGTNCNSVPNVGTGSAVYYNPTAGSAFAVEGCIYQAFLGAGGASGALGLPVSSEFTNDSAGDRQSDFEGGYIIWNRATGQTSVY